MLAEIRRLSSAGAPLSDAAVRERSLPLMMAARRFFGNWPRALRDAGIDPRRAGCRRRWSREAVVEAIRQLGRPVSASEIQRVDYALFRAAYRWHASWSKALRAAGVSAP